MANLSRPRFDLVVFDLAGTTVLDRDDVTRCFRATMQEKTGVELTPDEANTALGRPKDVAFADLLTRHGHASVATDRHVQDLLADFDARMVRYYLEAPDVQEYEGTSAVFRALRGMGVKVTLDTGFTRQVTAALVERMGWERNGLLDAWISCDQVQAGRPAPYMIYHLMERLGVADVARVMKVGDTPNDLKMGRNARCFNVGVLSGAFTRGQLEQHPHDLLLPDITRLPPLVTG